MTKTEALALFDRAALLGDPCSWERAARALATVLRAPVAAKGAKAKNKRHSLPSKSNPGARLPVFTKQACGHYFNSAGCATCKACADSKRTAFIGSVKVTIPFVGSGYLDGMRYPRREHSTIIERREAALAAYMASGEDRAIRAALKNVA
jgi:hypothetical protein